MNLSRMQKKLLFASGTDKKTLWLLHLRKDCNKNTTLVNGTRIALTCVTDYFVIKKRLSFFIFSFLLRSLNLR